MPAKKTTKKAVAEKAPAKKKKVKKIASKKATKKIAKPAKKAAIKPKVMKSPPSLEAIAKAAYLNYRRRMELGLPGNNDSDWLEAERSLNES